MKKIWAIYLILQILSSYVLSAGLPPVIREHPSSLVVRRNDPATLNCAASDSSRIRWFHNGNEVFPDERSHRVILPTGSLFFLRVMANKKESDDGTYWCVASNSYGSTRSRNATLVVTILDDSFLKLPPSKLKVLRGEAFALPCEPPKGIPPPTVFWIKDDELLVNSTRVQIIPSGTLLVSEATEADTGMYKCRAQNKAATRDSDATDLIVMVPPRFESQPKNITASVGLVVEFPCHVRGSPKPRVTWRRLDGKLPLERTKLKDDNTFHIEAVTVSDSGTYVCEAESAAGFISSVAVLKVIAPPQFLERPSDLQVLTGSNATLTCALEGEPPPSIFWRLPFSDRSVPLTAGSDEGRINVSPDGKQLTIKNTKLGDSGPYYCWGISSGGGVRSKASVFVVEAHPPPVFGIPPQDQWAEVDSSVTFSCEAVSEFSPVTISWKYQKSVHIPATEIRPDKSSKTSVAVNGALNIRNIKLEDTGIYTCLISSESGNLEVSALLKVLKPGEKIPKSAKIALPAPPSKPLVRRVNETSVELRWHPNSRSDNHDSYTIEYWRPGWHEWRIADTAIKEQYRVISGLNSDLTYVFLVRAVNKEGESFPSPWSDLVQSSSDEFLKEETRLVKRRLSRPLLSLTAAAPISPDSVLLTWDMISPDDILTEGVVVYVIKDKKEIQVATVYGTQSSSHLQRDLTPYTDYLFFIVPFWKSSEGTPSNSISIRTPEDVPAVPPENVQVKLQDEKSVLMTWSPLRLEETRGVLKGYKVLLSHNGSDVSWVADNPWLIIRDLRANELYTVQVGGMTSAGVGPMSAPLRVDFNEYSSTKSATSYRDHEHPILYAPPQPGWLIYLLIPLVILLSLAVLLYIRRLRRKTSSAHIQVPTANGIYSDPSLYSRHHHQHSVNMYGEQKLWRPSDSDKESSLSSTRLLRPDHLINEYAEPRVQRLGDVATEPYATTALLGPVTPRHCRSPVWMPQFPSEDSGVQVNWAAFLPPPPACPPPDIEEPSSASSTNSNKSASKGGATKYGSSSSKYDNMVMPSELYERPCDAASDHTYEPYSDMPPPPVEQGEFRTFSSLQPRGYRKVRAEFHPVRPSDSPKSHTH